VKESGGAIPHLNKMRYLPYVWINGLRTFDDALEQVKQCVSVMKEHANEADFEDIYEHQNFEVNLEYMKQLFERAELLARGKAKIL
jgi:hypothetical protein